MPNTNDPAQTSVEPTAEPEPDSAKAAEPAPVPEPELPTFVDDPVRYVAPVEAVASQIERSSTLTQVNYT